MKILLSEHKIQTISLVNSLESENTLCFTEALFKKLNPANISVFKTDRGQKVYPFNLKLKENTCELTANYYVGVDWLIMGEKFVQVEPKINSAVINAFLANTESDESGATGNEELEDVAEKTVASAQGALEVDFLRILLDLSDNPSTAPFISKVLKIDWDAEQIPIEQKDDRLTPFLIVQFLQVLKFIVRKGLKKSYYKVQNNLTNRVKGKILVGQHLKQNIFKNRITNTYCEYQEFGIDDLENRFLKKAFTFAINYVQNDKTFFQQKDRRKDDSLSLKEELLHIINYCRPAFENVSNEIKEEELKNVKFNPFFKEYKDGIKLGGYILKKFSYNISNTTKTKVTTPPFWIDMPILFELYVHRKLLEDNPGLSSKIKYQFGTYGNYLDLLICDKESPIIIDAKYKLHYQTSHIHQDIRQVAGYARLQKVRREVGLNCKDDRNIACLIIYPTLSAGAEELSITRLNEIISDSRSNSPFAIHAYHKVYKLGVELPLI